MPTKVIDMEQRYWLRRGQAERALARAALTSESRLIHYELAGRCRITAADAAPFRRPPRGRAPAGERAALQRPRPLRKLVAPPGRGSPGRRKGEAR